MGLNWNVISAVSDFVAAFTVVVTLLYLARQLREGREDNRVDNIARATESLNSIFVEISTNAEMSRIFHEGLSTPSSLTKDEISRFLTIFTMIVGRYGEVFYRHEKGRLQDEFWDGCSYYLKGLIRTPGGDLWLDSGMIKTLVPAYRNYITSLRRTNGVEA
jgi:hypothetical protein